MAVEHGRAPKHTILQSTHQRRLLQTRVVSQVSLSTGLLSGCGSRGGFLSPLEESEDNGAGTQHLVFEELPPCSHTPPTTWT